MNILILEDEPLAIRGIETILLRHFSEIELDKAQSIKEGERLLDSGRRYDVIISDIRLTDGLSFELFKKWPVDSPVIFTTAYDEYALDAFDYNGIAYVLKPVQEEKLVSAVVKVKERYLTKGEKRVDNEAFYRLSEKFGKQSQYKKRILSKVGNRVMIKMVDEIALFYTENKIVYMKEAGTGKRYMINYSLDELEKEHLDPDKFYRINRSVIISLDSLLEMNNHANGRLRLKLISDNHLDLIVARDRVSLFKEWINQ